VTIPMTASLRRLLWIPRLVCLAVFLSHGLGKITAFDAFQNKFALSTTSVVLLILAEITGVVGLVVGGLLRGRWGLWATWAGTVPLLISQIGAIVVARWPRWFEQYSGGEYNVTLIAVLAVIAIGHWIAFKHAPRVPLRSPTGPQRGGGAIGDTHRAHHGGRDAL
jgi:uncharacterized membrane protein YphA (DoxX/SURF4 family)